MVYESELYHHGIKGMKWGVRRYQNYDGTYTKRGLERYGKAQKEYDKAKATADASKQAYKSGEETKAQYKTDKRKERQAKKLLNRSYDKLKTDKMADQGKELYQKGKTISSNTSVKFIREVGVSLGAAAVYAIVKKKTGNKQLASVDAALVELGGSAVNSILNVKTHYDNKKLRAYYAH